MPKSYQTKKRYYKRKSSQNHRKYNTELCNDEMTFEDCEVAILRHAVDETEKIQGKEIANNQDVVRIIKILENFIITKKLLCYGGTAINNILPKEAQFYNRDLEVPDYDFFSPNALGDAKELADIFYNEGFPETEAKSGVHVGTFKVFVNFMPIADITSMNKQLYHNIFKESIEIDGIHYAPPNYLRMSIYLELSRPMGDVSRWEKVMKRLNLLNKYYPLVAENCHTIDFQRKMDEMPEKKSEILYVLVRDSFIDQGVIFFGGYATSLYSRYMSLDVQRIVDKIPDFDVLSEDIEKCANIVKERLSENGFHNVRLISHAAIGEIIPEHIEIRVGKDTIAFVYRPNACHSYNSIKVEGRDIHVATIDTILAFYLAFIYANYYSYYRERILCMAKFLFEVEEENRLNQRGLLKRFSINCYGEQETLTMIRNKKNNKYRELINKPNDADYEMWFLKYVPHEKGKTIKRNRVTYKQKASKPPSRGDFLI